MARNIYYFMFLSLQQQKKHKKPLTNRVEILLI